MLRDDAVKRRYLDTRFRFLKRARGKVLVHSFCVMDNHGREGASLLAEPKSMSTALQPVRSITGERIQVSKLYRVGYQ